MNESNANYVISLIKRTNLCIAGLFADVVSCFSALPVIPEVITGLKLKKYKLIQISRLAYLWEKWVMELHKSQTVLILPVVRLASSPVKPVDGCVPVRPDPLAVVMVGVVISLNSKFSSEKYLV